MNDRLVRALARGLARLGRSVTVEQVEREARVSAAQLELAAWPELAEQHAEPNRDGYPDWRVSR